MLLSSHTHFEHSNLAKNFGTKIGSRILFLGFEYFTADYFSDLSIFPRFITHNPVASWTNHPAGNWYIITCTYSKIYSTPLACHHNTSHLSSHHPHQILCSYLHHPKPQRHLNLYEWGLPTCPPPYETNKQGKICLLIVIFSQRFVNPISKEGKVAL